MSKRFLLATPLTAALSDEGRAAVAFLRSDASDKDKAEAAFRFIFGAGEHGLRYHFTEPLERLGAGALLRRGVDVALGLGLSGLKGPMRRVLGGMTSEQLHLVADEIEERLYPDPHG